MKNKILIIILACVMIASFALGATGAVTFAKDESADSSNEASKDRLIGVFITTEHLDLFDFESYFEDNVGHMVQGRKKQSFYEGKRQTYVDEANWIIVRNTHEPIVDEALFEAVQVIANQKKSEYHERLGKFSHLEHTENILQGLVWCPNCQRPLVRYKNVSHGKKLWYTFICPGHADDPARCAFVSIREDELSEVLFTAIQSQIAIAADLEDVVKKLNAQPDFRRQRSDAASKLEAASTTKSFKNKRKIDRPQEEWKIFPDTHPAIIDRETFKLVQELREHRRRPTRSGIVSMFSGLLYCADCGEKLYYCVANNYKREQAYFCCSSYRKNSDVCSAHYIREVVVEKLVLANMQRVFNFVQLYEKQFAEAQMANYGEEQKKALAEKRKSITKAKKRITEIDGLIQKIYEDNANGKLSDDRYATMSMAYEEEQRQLKEETAIAEEALNIVSDRVDTLQKFIDKVKKITQPTELTAELVHEFIDKIIVHAPKYLDGQRYQIIDIHYNGIGVIRGLSPEQMEAAFQNRKNLTDPIQIKTA